jgi:hypothetical protein
MPDVQLLMGWLRDAVAELHPGGRGANGEAPKRKPAARTGAAKA